MMAHGYLILNGGEAFTPRAREDDFAWLRYLRAGRQQKPRVIVLPVAATEKHRKIADEVTNYFRYLGALPECKMIIDRQTANTRAQTDTLDKVEVIALTDGSALDMVERLQGTFALEALRRAVYERKAALMGTAASAMALGAVHWFSGAWEPGLGVAPDLAIVAHHNLTRMRFSPERLLRDLPDSVTLIGIDQATTLVCHPDAAYQVMGAGNVTVYRSVEELDEYSAGQTFAL